ncbi:MAG: hypothetical protein KC619_33755 [Myxococcales bacterium]|nr:hypothetical protein [Myxococcales bacterium]
MVGGSRNTILVSALLLSSAMAHAQEPTPLELGIAAADAADFERAYAALDEAEAMPLSRADRVRLHATRALVAFALGREDDARADLARLLVLGANDALSPSAPPPLREALEALRREGVRPPTVVADAQIERGVARIEARAEGGGDLVRGVRIWIRDDDWRAFDRVERPIEAGAELRWYAEALGPGELLLATEGNREQPNVLRIQVEEVLLRPDDGASNDDALIWGVVGGTAGAIAVGVGIALAIVLGGTTEGTQLSGPAVE